LTEGLELRNGAQITTSTFGDGKGGDIMITAPSILLEGDSFENTPRIASETFSSAAEGTGGSIILRAEALTLNAAAEISTSTFGPANAGTIDITATALRLIGSDFALTTIMANANPLDPSGAGAGGDIVIHANSIDVKILGTSLNIRSYTNEKNTEAVLIRGSIEVTLRSSPDKKIILRPNEKLVVQNGKAVMIMEGKTAAAAGEPANEYIRADESPGENSPGGDGVVAPIHGVLHGVADETKEDEIERGHLADFPFAADANTDQHQKVYDPCSKSDLQQGVRARDHS